MISTDERLLACYRQYKNIGVTPLRTPLNGQLDDLIGIEGNLSQIPRSVLSYIADNRATFGRLSENYGLEKMFIVLMLTYKKKELTPDLVKRAVEFADEHGLYGLANKQDSPLFMKASPLESCVSASV